jgi:hypothetical protein
MTIKKFSELSDADKERVKKLWHWHPDMGNAESVFENFTFALTKSGRIDKRYKGGNEVDWH